MSSQTSVTVDANEAVASVAYRMNEVIAIYPITPASPMGEHCDEWAVQGKSNLWGQPPQVVEMQSEGGAAGAVHGSLQAGALTTTFTASQGLLLMIPNLYKIAGELNCFVLHVAARTLATHALSIFGDHSDVMACRQTGMAMLCASGVQEAHDFATIAHSATLKGRVPVMHFFDGFRTSHQIDKIMLVNDEILRAMIDEADIEAFRSRALTPDRPVIRGTAHNPDTFFQAVEAANPFYNAFADTIVETMKQFGELTGRQYQPFDYIGAPDAERVIVAMGSGCDTVHATVEHLQGQGEKVGVVKVRLYRPFDLERFAASLPPSVKSIAVLDRTTEHGSVGEPLYLDAVVALRETGRSDIEVIGGRYGISSKEFTPAMVKAVFDELAKPEPLNHFTVGITDDVTHRSLAVDDAFDIEKDVTRALFVGLGADGTVGANKNSIKIIGDATDLNAQGYFVYDSKKSGAKTVSHLRFGPKPIRAPYLIKRASFVACSQWGFMEKYEVLEYAAPGATVLLSCPLSPEHVFEALPREAQQAIVEKKLKVWCIDAEKVAGEVGLRGRTNTILQVCFFKLSGVIPLDLAIGKIKDAIEKTYRRKGDVVVDRNIAAVDRALSELHEVPTPAGVTTQRGRPPLIPAEAPEFLQRMTAVMMAGHGDGLPVSAFPPDGTWPTGTARWEKRNLASEIPIWEPELCIQCNKCAAVCPHTAILAAVYDGAALDDAPGAFKHVAYKAPDLRGNQYTIQVAPEDCTGCNLCVNVCPAKDKADPKRKAINMHPHVDHVDRERENFAFFESLPRIQRTAVKRIDAKGSQLLQPLFDASGACAGCGETPYVRLLTQLFGDRLMIANATGCSSIYGGNLPTTPYRTNAEGRGPTWANSLFEDNAEFGFGFRLASDQHFRRAAHLLGQMRGQLDAALVDELLGSDQTGEAGVADQRQRGERLRAALAKVSSPTAAVLDRAADGLVRKSVWMVGGDGWAYDIGYGGLDHVLASGRNINILVLDTEVYSNTGGQASKSTPLGAAAKYAIAGKAIHKKDLGLLAMSYGHVYVASVSLGANDNHVLKALQEAEAYPGPSLVIAYSHCIAHGYDLKHGLSQQKLAVESGVWPLYRFDPRRTAEGKPPLRLDSGPVKARVRDYHANETRFRMVQKMDPQRYARLEAQAERESAARVELYKQLAQVQIETTREDVPAEAEAAAV